MMNCLEKKKMNEIKVLETIELPKRKLTKKEIDILYNDGKSLITKKDLGEKEDDR